MKATCALDNVVPQFGIDALIAYDQLEAYKCAEDLCARVSRRVGAGCEMNITAWNFRLLQSPAIMCSVARRAARAALIIIAADGGQELPSGIKTWIGMIVGAKGPGTGLFVAQFHGIGRDEKERAPAYLYLKQLVEAAGLDFLAQVVEPINMTTTYNAAGIQERANKRTALLERILVQKK